VVETALIFSICALFFCFLGFLFSVLNLIELRAQKLSTHQVQFVDPYKEWEQQLDKTNQDNKESNDLDNVF
jgi:hypothetical protein